MHVVSLEAIFFLGDSYFLPSHVDNYFSMHSETFPTKVIIALWQCLTNC